MLASTTIPDRLEQAIASGMLPEAGLDAAHRVLERLRRPLRLAILGLPGSGKSTLVNLLAGEAVIDEGLSLPPVLLEFGSPSQTICMSSDGEQKLEGINLEEALELSPAFITVQASFAALSKISILDVSATSDTLQQRRAISWACKRADVVIWCSHSFDTEEQALWSEVPDSLKDHAILALAKSDLLGTAESIAMHLSNVQNVAQDEFYLVTAISAKIAQDAKAEDGTFDRAAFKSSGASELISTIKGQVETGRRASLDYAQMLLEKYADESAAVPAEQITAKPIEKVIPDSVEPTAAAHDPVEPKVVAGDSIDVSSLKAVFDDRVSDLKSETAEQPEVSISGVLEHCRETLDLIAAEMDAVSSPGLDQFSKDIAEAQDLLMLMQLEDVAAAAEESLAVLLQLRRDLETITLR